MTDAYSQFRRRKAVHFKELEALEAEQRALKANRPTPQQPFPVSRSHTSALTDAQIARLCDSKVEAALNEFVCEFSRGINAALDDLGDETARELDKDAARFKQKLAEQREEFERKLAEQRREFEDELAALRVSDAITRSLIGHKNVLPFDRGDDGVIRKNCKSENDLEREVATTVLELKRSDVA
jgi:predicted ribosome quality control (RQC) complex YloA/Tae2 family protein